MHDLGLSKTQFRKAVHEANICLRCMKTFVTEKASRFLGASAACGSMR